MPRAGPLRAMRNPSHAYKATSASRSPEFNACTKSLWRSSGASAEFKVGDLVVPVSLVNDALQKKLAEQRDYVGKIKIENDELILKHK